MNRFTGAFREAVQVAYNGLGGHAAFIKWGKKNKTEFYRIASRLIPVEIKGGLNNQSLSVIIESRATGAVPAIGVQQEASITAESEERGG